MVRTIVYLFVAIVVLGTIATPGLGALAFVVAPLLGLGLLWRIALTVSTHGRPLDAVVHKKQSHLLGPGGPGDSFAASPLDEDEYPTEVSARASVSARNGLVRGANVPRPGLSETLSVCPGRVSRDATPAAHRRLQGWGQTTRSPTRHRRTRPCRHYRRQIIERLLEQSGRKRARTAAKSAASRAA